MTPRESFQRHIAALNPLPGDAERAAAVYESLLTLLGSDATWWGTIETITLLATYTIAVAQMPAVVTWSMQHRGRETEDSTADAVAHILTTLFQSAMAEALTIVQSGKQDEEYQ